MKILFITLIGFDNIYERGIYSDLMRCFVENGHNVTIVAPIERRFNKKTYLNKFENYQVLRVNTFNIQKTNIIEKTIGTFYVDFQLKKAIQKHIDISDTELIIYSTPPITLVHTIQYVKAKTNAKTYLLLKDIFPQNAVDLNFISKSSLFYKYFRKKEKLLYQLSDNIGCMSPANVDYVLKHNAELNPKNVAVCPNSVYPYEVVFTAKDKSDTKSKYGLPTDKRIFLYGGNLGKPQGIDFIIEFLESNITRKEAFFLIIGAGTEYQKLSRWIEKANPSNVKVVEFLPKSEYDEIVKVADVGMIFLDFRFTIPNFPSRLLSYLEIGIPVIAATDPNTDIGKIIEKNGFGKACLSNNVEKLNEIIDYYLSINDDSLEASGMRAKAFAECEYNVINSYKEIINANSIRLLTQ